MCIIIAQACSKGEHHLTQWESLQIPLGSFKWYIMLHEGVNNYMNITEKMKSFLGIKWSLNMFSVST